MSIDVRRIVGTMCVAGAVAATTMLVTTEASASPHNAAHCIVYLADAGYQIGDGVRSACAGAQLGLLTDCNNILTNLGVTVGDATEACNRGFLW